MLLTYILLIFCVTGGFSEFSLGDKCGSNKTGICRTIQDCPEALGLVTQRKKPELCGFQGKTPIACCYDPGSTDIRDEPLISVPMSQLKCAEYNSVVCPKVPSNNKLGDFHVAVIGGVEAKPRELPFMGLVGFGSVEDIDWACGCSLISYKFVLSAAHCTKHPAGGFADWVRLGVLEVNVNRKTTLQPPPKDFRISRRLNHPDYDSKQVYNDIALFELESNVPEFTDYIRPICLPTVDALNGATTVFGAGWGVTEEGGPRSNTLMKVDLNIFELNTCNGTASDTNQVPRGLDRNSMICAGATEGGKDTCSGDSGGPLFLQTPGCGLLTQLGITSFGRQCALKGFPGVYTNVLNYIPWIESIVWPEGKRDNILPGTPTTRPTNIWT